MMEVKQREKNVSIDLSRVAPLYVSSITLSYKKEQKVLLVGFFSGMPIPVPSQDSQEGYTHVMQEQFISAFFLDVDQALYLYQNLHKYLSQVGALENEKTNREETDG